MTDSDLTEILRSIGWVIDRDEVGDVFCVFSFSDRQVQTIPSIAMRADHYRIGFMPSVSTEEFSDVVSAIFGKGDMHQPIINRHEIPVKITDPTAQDIIKISDEILSWAENQDIEKGLEVYRGLPTDAKGAMPVRHLAALAIGGELKKLLSYQDSFEKGNRLGFAPYITKEMIERAALIAKRKIAAR